MITRKLQGNGGDGMLKRKMLNSCRTTWHMHPPAVVLPTTLQAAYDAVKFFCFSYKIQHIAGLFPGS